jgi:hypothetical protein
MSVAANEALGGSLVLGASNVFESLGGAMFWREPSWSDLPDVRLKPPNADYLVPQADGPLPRLGQMRVNWVPKQLNPQGPSNPDRLKVTVHSRTANAPGVNREFEIPYLAVTPLGAFPKILEFGELISGAKRTVNCFVWSMTRDSLDLKVKMGSQEGLPNPNSNCFEVGVPAEVPAKERATLAKTLGVKHAENRHPTCAYRIPVTVHESRMGQQFDLGPFQRTLEISGVPGMEIHKVPITGVVRGVVRVLGADDKDRINLGSFKQERGRSETVTLQAPPGVQLTCDRTTTEAIKPTLTPDKETPGQWRLTVEALPGSYLPLDAAVILRVEGPTPRSLRIPVTGNAYR